MDGRLILAAAVDEQLWQRIHRAANHPAIAMGCCGRRAVAVTNAQGTRFFRHAARAGCGARVEHPSSAAQLTLAICHGATRAGFSPDHEWQLAAPARGRVKARRAGFGSTEFVILSRRVSPIEAATMTAQAAQARSTVVWLGARDTVASLSLTTQPAFEVDERTLTIASVRGTAWVAPDLFAERWLTGKIGYAARGRPGAEQLCSVSAGQGFCRSCRVHTRTLALAGSWLSTCGRPLWAASLRDLARTNPGIQETAAEMGLVMRFEAGSSWRLLCSTCESPLAEIVATDASDQLGRRVHVTLNDVARSGMRDRHWCVGSCDEGSTA